MTCGFSNHRRVTGSLRERNVLILKACDSVFSGVRRAVTRVEQLRSFGGIRSPVGWWRKRPRIGPVEPKEVGTEIGWVLEVVEEAMAQCFPGIFLFLERANLA